MRSQLLQNRMVYLRPVEHGDAELLMELNNDDEIANCVVGNPRKVTLKEQLQWMERLKDETGTKRFIIQAENEAVGTVILTGIDRNNRLANINIKLKRSAQGRGFGKASILLCLEYCFGTLDLFCVTAHILPYNTASIALVESCGFEKEGVLRSRVVKNGQRFDLLSYSILREDAQ